MRSSLSLALVAVLAVASSVVGKPDSNNGGSSNSGNSGSSNSGNSGSSSSSSNSLTLSQNLLCTGCQQNGQGANGTKAGQVASLTSNNNFINFCGDPGQSNLPITNGIQITSGSCNPVPMGVIAAVDKMPAAKFTNPKNLDTIQANQDFTVTMAIQNLQAGNFVNADSNYFAAPCQANANGVLIGHSHVTIQQVNGLQDTAIADPQQFAFFKGIDTAAQNGVLSVPVAGGLPAGTYRLASINSCANHQAVAAAVAQRGSHDDMVYFTVSNGGGSSASNSGSTSSTSSTSSNSGNANSSGSTSGSTSSGSTSNSGSNSNSNGQTQQQAQGQQSQGQQAQGQQAQGQQAQGQQAQGQQAQGQQAQGQQAQGQQGGGFGGRASRRAVEDDDADAELKVRQFSGRQSGAKFQSKNKRLIKRRLALEKRL